jgi:signal peptide peptidase SppA
MQTNNMVAALQRLSGREMLINTETADEFLAHMTRFADTTRDEAMAHEVTSREALCLAYGIDDQPAGEGRKQFVYQDGIAVIPVHGALINRFNSSWGFVTGYNFIRRQMNLILADDDVEYFIFDVNTPGGEASGCFELAREIMMSRQIKPSLAMVDSLAASGGMAIAGSATKMYGIPSARIGSIGVYRQHISVEEALKDAGVKVTFAQAGDHKTDGQPYKDLPDSVLRDWTQDVNKTWDDFIELVAESRDMDPAAVRDTQARIYRADEALALGLINAVKTTADAVPAFVAEMGDDTIDDEEEENMDNGKKTGSEATSGVDYEKIGGMISAGVASAMSGVLAAQNRQNAIREHGKAKGQVALAAKLSANDKLTEAEAIEMIDAAAAASAPKPKTPKPNNRVEDGGEGGEGDDDGDLDDDAGDGEGDGEDDGEDGEQEARDRRRGSRVRGGGKRDNVNHLAGAMRGKGAGVGAGQEGEGKLTGDAAATATLLGDYAAHTGTQFGKKQAA